MDKILRGVGDVIRRRRRQLRATFKRLAHAQNPMALLLTCSDSRVVSSLLLGADSGDLFEVRTVGNLIAPASTKGAASVGNESEAAAIVAERIGRGEVELDGAWFDVERADLHAWSNAERRFVHMDEETISRALRRRAAASS